MATVATTQVSNPLVTTSVQDFMRNNNFVSVHREVRMNTNKYPYITFINGKNEAENIYFSKAAAENVSEGQPIVKGFFNDYVIGEATNEAGEKRIKLMRSGSSTRLSVDDLF